MHDPAYPVQGWLWPELRSWWAFEPTQATITTSEVHSWPGRGRGAAHAIRFSYRAGGAVHHTGGWRITAVREGHVDEVAALVARHPVGSVHPAWYDPDEPSVAVLSRALSVPALIPLIFGVAPVAVPVLLWWLVLRPRG